MIKTVAAPLLVALVLPVAAAMPASAQVESREGIALQNQILDLRRQLQTLQDQTARGGGNPTNLGRAPYSSSGAGSSDLVAQLLSRVDTLEDQVRQLRGRVDETQNEVQRQGADLGKRIDDMQFQLQTPQGARPNATQPRSAEAVPSAPAAPAATAAASSAPSPPVRRTPELSLQEGNAALARRDYTGAEQAAREVPDGKPHVSSRVRRAIPAGPGVDGPTSIFSGRYCL